MSERTIVLIAFILAKFVLQYALLDGEYELHRDEFLHLDQGHHLAWGYISVPPVTSFISLVIFYLGSSLFWIRFFPALFGTLTILFVWKSIETLKGNLFALTLGATCTLFSALLRLNMLYQPNSLDVLCWTAFYFMLIKFTLTQYVRWFYAGMLALAIGFLNKYNIMFLTAGLVPALLIDRRSIFTSKHLYISLLLFVLIIMPNLVWQYNNNFPVYHHMQLLVKTQLVNVNRLEFLKDQVLYFIGSLLVIIAGLFALLFYPPFKRFRFFFWTLCFTLLVFVYLKAKSYYAMGLYPIYIAFGSVYLETARQLCWRKYLRPAALIIPILLFIPMYRIMFPNKSPDYIVAHAAAYKNYGLLRWEDGKDHALPQDYADMLGWKELAREIDSIYATLPAGEQTLILCDNYGQAGAINYYSRNKNVVANSFNADYINWFKLDRKFVNLIRVKGFESQGNELKETSPFFQRAFNAASISNAFAREFGTAIYVFERAKIDVNQRIREEINAEKQRWLSDYQ